MMRKKLPPDNPAEWRNPAKSSLALAKQHSSEIYREDLCFPAQQATEKAIKSVYLSKKLVFPYIHDIAQLLSSLEQSDIVIPKEIRAASKLTMYAAQTRYPGLDGPVSEEEYREAVAMAERVVLWADKYIKTR